MNRNELSTPADRCHVRAVADDNLVQWACDDEICTMNWKPPAPIDASPENRARVSGPGLRTLLNVARVWELDVSEIRVLLGLPTAAEFQVWSDAARADQPLILEADVLLRISAVLGIYRSLRLLEGSEDEGLKWLRSVNREIPFSGKAPLELMLAGFEPGLMDVRGYLLAKEHGGGSAPNEVDRNFKPYTDADLIWI